MNGGNRARIGTSFSCKEKERRVGGYITIYLVLTLVSLLTLYMVLISGARIGAARMQMESVSRISQNATLAEFHKELHSRYDLFFTDTSYGGPGGGSEVLAQHLRNDRDSNCARKADIPLTGLKDWTSMEVTDVRVTQARYACDNGGRAVREQVYAYMSADPVGAVVSELLVTADQWRGLEISGKEWTVKTKQSREELREALREGREAQREENEEKEENEENVTPEEYEAASEEPSEAESMVNEMESFEFLPVLFQVFGDTDRLSDRRVGTGKGLCERDVHLGTGMMAANSHKYPAADEILFDRYIYEKMGSCTRPCEDGQLSYQTEYILCGKDSDRENLEAIALRLLMIREASNCAYLFMDDARMSQVRLVAAAAALIMFNPDLEKPVSNALALAWSYLESVQDVRTLMTGGKVPIIKTGSSWQTHLYELLSPLTAIKDRDSGEGIDYSAYLQGLLLLEGSTVKTQRTMDVMEMDIRKITGNSGFRMDLCMDEFTMSAAAQACGTEFLFEGSSGYN